MNEMDVIRKAAVLVASLERDAADVLLDQLEPAQAESIRHAVMSMPEIDGREEAETIREFLGARNGSVNGHEESGDLPHTEASIRFSMYSLHSLATAPGSACQDKVGMPKHPNSSPANSLSSA